jgi:hypothetical protein
MNYVIKSKMERSNAFNRSYPETIIHLTTITYSTSDNPVHTVRNFDSYPDCLLANFFPRIVTGKPLKLKNEATASVPSNYTIRLAKIQPSELNLASSLAGKRQ